MKNNNIGYIHSIETMGLLDGPGIRFVVFMQGCYLRCLYCHNPDTWALNKGMRMTPEQLVKKIERYQPYFQENGGVTFSGGDPLVQSEFLLACLKLCKERHIHTAIDTAGVGGTMNEEVLAYTDLVLWDVKALNETSYQSLVGKKIIESLGFLKLCQKLKKKMWIRQVIVPGINDTEEYIHALADFLRPLRNIEKIELLPYSLFGVHKYKEMGLPYRLEGVPAMDKERCEALYQLLLTDLREVK